VPVEPSKTRLSRRQQQILDFIRDSVVSRGFPPSIREIGEAVGLSSSSTVHSHLRSLETKGFLRRNPSKPRSIELLDGPRGAGARLVEIPVGDPSRSEPGSRTISLPLELVGDQESFAFQVEENYRNESIVPGDLVIINRNMKSASGELVLTRELEGLKLTRMGQSTTKVDLQSEILGKVVGIIRKFGES
jgi:repressor LexA